MKKMPAQGSPSQKRVSSGANRRSTARCASASSSVFPNPEKSGIWERKRILSGTNPILARKPQPDHEQVAAEAFVAEEVLAETVIAPLRGPGHVRENRQYEADLRLVEARRTAPIGREQRAPYRHFSGLAGVLRQRDIEKRGYGVGILAVEIPHRGEELRLQVVDIGPHGVAAVFGQRAEALADVGRPRGGHGILAPEVIVPRARRRIFVAQHAEVRAETERGPGLERAADAPAAVIGQAGAEVFALARRALEVGVHGEELRAETAARQR